MFDEPVIVNTAFSELEQFYQLTDLCSNYAIQLKEMSGICEVWKN